MKGACKQSDLLTQKRLMFTYNHFKRIACTHHELSLIMLMLLVYKIVHRTTKMTWVTGAAVGAQISCMRANGHATQRARIKGQLLLLMCRVIFAQEGRVTTLLLLLLLLPYDCCHAAL